MRRVAITGATGFIGRRLVARMTRLGIEVVHLGRTPLTAPEGGLVEYVRCDLADPAAMRQCRPQLKGLDTVVHLAAAVRQSAAGPDEMEANVRVNVDATARLLDMLPSSVQSICYASTLDVYGPPMRLPVDEMHPQTPHTFYGVTKLAGEGLIRVYGDRHDIPCTLLRFTNVYGPGDPSAKVIPTLLRHLEKGTSPVIVGSGEDRRDFLFVEDAVDAVMLAIERRPSGTFNIATGQSTSIAEAWDTLCRVAGVEIAPTFRPRLSEPVCWEFDVSRATSRLGFTAATSLWTGLQRTLTSTVA